MVGSTCACFAIRKASRAVTQIFDGVLRPTSLRVTQLTLLVAIAQAGSAPITRLGDRLGMDRTTLTRNLKPLERRGLITIGPGKDRRVRVVRLTARGEDALTKALPLWERAQARVVNRLGPKRWNALREAVSTVASLAGRS